MTHIKIEIPHGAKIILNRLKEFGFEGYIVGGCIRDFLIQREPDDWDIATNALPAQIMQCFKDYSLALTGVKHGTITVIINDESYEITTYRIDGKYVDFRHPIDVAFTERLKDDLSRRDFTINAFAYNDDVGLVDFFGGIKDLDKGLIKTVGLPEQRLEEDALRILRGVRFASQLNFIIDDFTWQAMLDNLDNLDHVSEERIREELNKSVRGESVRQSFTRYKEVYLKIIPELKPMVGLDQKSKYHKWDVFEHTLRALEVADNTLPVRLAVLFHDIGKPDCFTVDEAGTGHFKGHAHVSADITRDIMNRLKYSNEMKSRVLTLVKYHEIETQPTSRIIKRRLRKFGEETFRQILEVQKADSYSKVEKFRDIKLNEIAELEVALDKVIAEEQCFSLRQLNINGDDLIKLGFQQGRILGETLEGLLDRVVEDEIPNDRELLIKEAKLILKEI